MKLNNFYRMGKVKWGADVHVQCIKYRPSEKGKQDFKWYVGQKELTDIQLLEMATSEHKGFS